MNTIRFKIARIAATILIAIVALVASMATPTTAATSALDFSNTMRKLWEDHITWTRVYIVDVAADLPDRDATAQRLLQNQVDIGNAIKPFYGDAAGEKLTALLKDHILGAVELLDAAKANDAAKVEAAKAKWSANADEIATFLNNANPQNWPLADMKAAMKMHLDLTLNNEATPRLKGDFAADIKGYDEVHNHILGLADTLSTGIIKQFPDKVAAPAAVPAPAPAPAELPTTGESSVGSTLVPVLLAVLIGSLLVGLGFIMQRRAWK